VVLFRLEIAAPRTNTSNAFTRVLTNTDNQVQQISVALKKEKGRISYLTADIFDPRWKLFNALPDIAFFDVPVRLYMPPLDAPQAPPTLVFEGIATTYEPHYPDWRLQLVAHDKSFKARLNATQQVIKGKTSAQAAEMLARRYGLTAEITADVTDLVARASDISVAAVATNAMSDWQQVTRMLESDGLRGYVKGNRLVVERLPTKTYRKTFKPDEPACSQFSVRVQHVRGPGHGGDTITPAFENRDSSKSVRETQGTAQREADAMTAGQARTARRPVGGRPHNHDGSHAEAYAAKWSNQVTRFRHRKDEATWIGDLTPDLFPDYKVTLDGWGPKVNGEWDIEEVGHVLVPNENGSQTTLKLTRGLSKQGAPSVGIPFETIQRSFE
jgi:phage protein D